MSDKPKLIKTWKELSEVPDSEEFKLEIDVDGCNGFIYRKSPYGIEEYLSTHTFYGSKHEYSTKTLQALGFNVVIDNWDK